jgi:hypothetical protein
VLTHTIISCILLHTSLSSIYFISLPSSLFLLNLQFLYVQPFLSTQIILWKPEICSHRILLGRQIWFKLFLTYGSTYCWVVSFVIAVKEKLSQQCINYNVEIQIWKSKSLSPLQNLTASQQLNSDRVHC